MIIDPDSVIHEPVILIGASCRAAAQAIHALGIRVIAYDMFADRDTQLYCDVEPFETWELLPIRRILNHPSSIVLPCGGLENHPKLWDELARKHLVLGPTAAQLVKLRDPFWLQEFFHSLGKDVFVPLMAESVDQLATLPGDQRWLLKHRQSGGGLKTNPVRVEAELVLPKDAYLQEYVAGEEISVVILCRLDAKAKVVSVNEPIRQQQNEMMTYDFRYVGSRGPCTLDDQTRSMIEAAFTRLAKELQYVGMLQADMIACPGQVALIELNPRWTASMEIAESLAPGSLLQHFCDQSGMRLPLEQAIAPESRALLGTILTKHICYASEDIEITREASDTMMQSRMTIDLQSQPEQVWLDYPKEVLELLVRDTKALRYRLADIPVAGTLVRTGQPICSVIFETLE